MTTKQIVIVIDRYEGDLRSTPEYQKMFTDYKLPEGYEVVFISDKELRGMELDQVWIDELNSLEAKEFHYEPERESYDYLRPEKQYWQRGRW